MTDTLLSVKQAAEKLSCSEASIWKWIQQDRLQKVKVGRLTRVKAQDIDAIVRLRLPARQGVGLPGLPKAETT